MAAGAAILINACALERALAQGAEDSSAVPATRLERIVVGAGREKVAIDTPQAVSVVDQEELDEAQPTTIGDVLDDLPGVKSIGSDRVMGESFNIRGIGAGAAADEPRIIVNVDGTSKFYEQYRMGSFFSDPELYKRAEVLRGPASSTLYGSGAIAGVINLTTKDATDFLDPGEKSALRQKFQYADNGDEFLTSTIGAAQPIDGVELLGAFNYRTGDEFEDGNGDIVDGTDFSSGSGLAKARLTFGPDKQSAFSASYQKWHSEQNDQPYSQIGLGGGAFTAFGTVDRDVTDETIVTKFEHAPLDRPWLDLAVTASYSSTFTHQSDVDPALIFAFGEEWDIAYETLQLRVENNAEMAGDGWNNYLTFGVQLADLDRVSDATLFGAPFAVGSHPAGNQQGAGAYVQSEFVWREWLTLIPGIRFDHIGLEAADSVSAAVVERRHDYQLFSPKLAVLAKLTGNFSLFGSIAHTERAPVLDELYDTDGQLDLQPEKSDNYEAGIASSFSDVVSATDALRAKVTFFYNDVSDLIYREADGDPYFNADGETYQGVELEASYDARYVFGRLAYSMIRGELFDGADLNSIPADELVVTLGGKVPSHDLVFGWRGVKAWDQDRVLDPTSTIEGGGAPTPGYFVNSLFASWQPDEGTLADTVFRFGIENVFDKQYREHLSGDDARGRTFRVTVSKKF